MRQSKQLILQLITSDQILARPAELLQSVLGLGGVMTAMLISELPKLSEISVTQAAVFAGFAPVANESGAFKRQRSTKGGRQALHHIFCQEALVASRMKLVTQKMKAAGKPYKGVMVPVGGKLLDIVASMCKHAQNGTFRQSRDTVACFRVNVFRLSKTIMTDGPICGD